VGFHPTGRYFVSGSYDRTIRIFKFNEGRSKDVYHTRRMNRAFAVAYSRDGRFILSGSDDMNVRLWKAEASKPVGVVSGGGWGGW
jgi:DDB1- and CUL4-associated factor 13